MSLPFLLLHLWLNSAQAKHPRSVNLASPAPAFSAPVSTEAVPGFTDEVCEDYQKIAQEFIDVELAGFRWQGSDDTPMCLKAAHPQTLNVDRVPAGDPALLDPEFLLPENRKVDFTVKHLPNDLLEIVMNYIGKKNKKDVPVKDQFILKLNYGRVRDLRGCASWYSEPQHFVMRSKCWKE